MKISDKALRELKGLSDNLARACWDEDYRKRLKENPEIAIPSYKEVKEYEEIKIWNIKRDSKSFT